jgi:uncharacterized membrane protein YjjP (DUF1212 family)
MTEHATPGGAHRTGLIDRLRGALAALRPSLVTGADAQSDSGVTGMLGQLGAAALASSKATSDVEETLRRLAASYGRPELRIFVLPTLVLIEDPATAPSQTSIFPADGGTLRLDQAGAIDRLVRRALDERLDPDAVLATVATIRSGGPRFGAVLTVIGYALLTFGFGMVLNPTIAALPVYLVLGLAVGTIVVLGSRIPTLSLVLPVATAFLVTLVVSLGVIPLVGGDDVVRLVAPSLVSFLPGLTLTIAAVELTSGQVMAGASRLVYGVAQLGLLAFGVFAGISVAGTSPTATGSAQQLGGWAPWAGLVLVGLGYYLYSAAPRGSLLWILYALVVAHAAQLLGALLVGAELSGLFGALIVIPAVGLAGRIRRAPSTAIMLTCAYWVLVPGSMGFIGLSEVASGTAGATSTILRTFGSLIAIAIGMVLGAGFSRDVVALARGWRHPHR